MLFKEIFRMISRYLFYFSFLIFIPLFVSIYYEFIASPELNPQPPCTMAFLITIAISFFIAFLFYLLGKKATGNLYRRESMLLVAIIWIITASIGALPFYFSNTLNNPIDAFFESMSGLTTTGATTFAAKEYNSNDKEIPISEVNIHVPTRKYEYYGTITPVRNPVSHKILYSGTEAVCKGLLLWRSFLQWIGGMGIVVLFLAVLPALNVGGKFLYQMEVPGPTKDTLAPRIKETASLLWKLYLGLTVAEIYLLLLTNHQMPLFDAFCITFSNLSTGGFTVRNASIGAYNNAWTDWVVMLFMVFGNINFALYFYIIKRKLQKLNDPDFLFFLALIFTGSVIVTYFLIGQPQSMLDGTVKGTYSLASAIRYGFFQAISAQTSTGFATANYDLWPFPSQMFMLLLMLIGGMSGSTAGGIKSTRILILFKIIIDKINSLFRPDVVKKLTIGEKEIAKDTASTAMAFFCLTIFFVTTGTVLLVLNGIDPETSIGSIICMMHNVGFAFRAAGPLYSFAFFPAFAKIVSALWMLLGRLEYFAILLLLIPDFWRRKRY